MHVPSDEYFLETLSFLVEGLKTKDSKHTNQDYLSAVGLQPTYFLW